MGRQRSGTEKTKGVLDEPYSASPTRSPRWGYTVRHEGRYCFQTCYSLYAAKKEIEAYINGQSYKWLTPRQIMCENGLTIQSEKDDGLEKIIDYEYSQSEGEWQVPEPRASEIRRFISGVSAPIQRAVAPEKKEPTQKPERKPKVSKDGLITIANIASDINLDPRDARAALRALKVEKPDAGWAWPADQAEKIKEQLRTYQK